MHDPVVLFSFSSAKKPSSHNRWSSIYSILHYINFLQNRFGCPWTGRAWDCSIIQRWSKSQWIWGPSRKIFRDESTRPFPRPPVSNLSSSTHSTIKSLLDLYIIYPGWYSIIPATRKLTTMVSAKIPISFYFFAFCFFTPTHNPLHTIHTFQIKILHKQHI